MVRVSHVHFFGLLLSWTWSKERPFNTQIIFNQLTVLQESRGTCSRDSQTTHSTIMLYSCKPRDKGNKGNGILKRKQKTWCTLHPLFQLVGEVNSAFEKLVKVILNFFYILKFSVTKRFRKHCSYWHYWLTILFMATLFTQSTGTIHHGIVSFCTLILYHSPNILEHTHLFSWIVW